VELAADAIGQRRTFENGKLERRPNDVRANPGSSDHVHGGDRIGPDKDRIDSHGHGQSTAHDIGHEARGMSSGSRNCVQASPLIGFWARNRPRDLRRDRAAAGQPMCGRTSTRSVHPVRPIRRIGCRHVHRAFMHHVSPASAHPFSCKWALGFGPARREV
jgi:hypothetical protein